MSARSNELRKPTFSADCMEPRYFDGRGEFFALECLELPAELLSDVLAWNEDYQWVVPLSRKERSSGAVRRAIVELDERGLALNERLREAMGLEGLEYFSEGFLRRVRDVAHLRELDRGEGGLAGPGAGA